MEPPSDRLNPAVWRIVAVVVIGSFMSQLDATVVNVSLSTLSADLHSTLSSIQWVTSGYLLALALTLPLNGWLVARIGAKRLYLLCFAGFTLSSVFCGLAWSAPSLIAFRMLQGMSGGLLAPMSQMMMARAAGQHMAQVVGIAAMPVLLAPLLGPVVAGAILQFASWRWLFFINLPVGALGLLLAFAFLPDEREAELSKPLDFVGLVLLSPGLVLFLYGSSHLGSHPGVFAFAISIAMLATFLFWAVHRGERALVDIRLFNRKLFSASVIVAFIMNGISFAGQMLIPFFLIRAFGLRPRETGLLMAPLGLGMMCAYPLMGMLTKRFGIRALASTGAALALCGTLPFLFLATRGLSIPILAAALFVRGLGVSAVGIPAITSAYASVPREDLPMATTALNIVQRLGGPTLTTLCATYLGWRLASVPSHHPTSGAFAAALGLLCILHAVLLLAAARLPWRVERPAAGGDNPNAGEKIDTGATSPGASAPRQSSRSEAAGPA